MIKTYKTHHPIIGKTSKVFEGAHVIGRVTIGEHVGVWFNAVIRGDMAEVTIGDRTNVQDQVVIHTNKNLPTHIGSDITIGHLACIHAATIKDGSLIGMGSIILDGAIVEEQAYVAAGTLVPPNKVVPAKTLVMGNPMKVVRALRDDELLSMKENALFYVNLIKDYQG